MMAAVFASPESSDEWWLCQILEQLPENRYKVHWWQQRSSKHPELWSAMRGPRKFGEIDHHSVILAGFTVTEKGLIHAETVRQIADLI